MSNVSERAPRFHVGDWVTLPYGPRRVLAQVLEDRGPLGVGRRRLYRVRLDREEAPGDTFEVREEFLEAAAEPDTNGRDRGAS